MMRLLFLGEPGSLFIMFTGTWKQVITGNLDTFT